MGQIREESILKLLNSQNNMDVGLGLAYVVKRFTSEQRLETYLKTVIETPPEYVEYYIERFNIVFWTRDMQLSVYDSSMSPTMDTVIRL